MKTDSRLLPDGRRVGPLSWGCWRLVTEDVSEARRRMETALSLGVNMIDTLTSTDSTGAAQPSGKASRPSAVCWRSPRVCVRTWYWPRKVA